MTDRKVYLLSLGCDKNLVDSEKTLGLLSAAGYEYTEEPLHADVVIVNTCCFIEDALKESIDALIGLCDLKKERGASFRLVVMGCMAERYRHEIRESLPEVDITIGIGSRQDIVSILESDSVPDGGLFADRPASSERYFRERVLSGPGHYAYLKIAEGCDRNCSYCVIPKLRGRYRSVPVGDLITEAEDLARKGARELVLVAQETTLYGTDLYGKKALALLLSKLSLIEGIHWLRLMYTYPEEIDDELIETIGKLPKVVKYLDIPIQSGSDRVLSLMGRRTRHGEIVSLAEKLRDMIPGIALRTTLIAGFPGESEADHLESVRLVRELSFDRLGVFEYSREAGTPAASLAGQVPKAVKKKRRSELMRLQKEISLEKNRLFTGSELEAIVEGRLPDEGGIYVGRTYRDAPDVDGLIYFDANRKLMTGDFVRVCVRKAGEYDLFGEMV